MEQQMALPVVSDAGMSEQVETLQRMHAQKVRTLMTSIHVLKEQLQVAKAASKEHRRSALIQQLRDAIRDGEVVVDVLRQALVDRGLDDRTVNELIIKRTCSGPKRFRPRSREELQRDCTELEKKVKQLEAALAKSKAAAAASSAGRTRGTVRTQAVAAVAGQQAPASPGGDWGGMFASPAGKDGRSGGSADAATPDRAVRASSAPGGASQKRRASTNQHTAIEAAPESALDSVGYDRSEPHAAHATPRSLTAADGLQNGVEKDQDLNNAVALGQEVSALQLEVAELRATLAGRERVLADQAREVERLSAQEREAERAAARADELRHKYRELKSAYRDQHSRLALALETSAATGARLRAAAEESAARCEEAEARATALGDEFGGRLAELRDALTREAASAASAEAARAAASEDRAKLKHAARQAEDAREGLAKRLGLELNRTKRLEAKVAALEEEVAQKSSAELERETLKGKLRSATVSSKELGKELTMLRHKHEATLSELAAQGARLEESSSRFHELQLEATEARHDLKRLESNCADAQQALHAAKLAARADAGRHRLEAERVKLDLEGQAAQVRAAATQQELSLQAELSASQRELVQVRGARDTLADEKAKLSEQHAQLAHELEAARAQKHESMSAAAAQHGAVAEALSKELDEARVRLRGAERRVEVEAGRARAKLEAEQRRHAQALAAAEAAHKDERQSQLAASDAAAEALKAQMSSMASAAEQAATAAKSALEEAERATAAARAECATLSSEVARLEREVQKWREECHAATLAAESAKREAGGAQAALQQLSGAQAPGRLGFTVTTDEEGEAGGGRRGDVGDDHGFALEAQGWGEELPTNAAPWLSSEEQAANEAADAEALEFSVAMSALAAEMGAAAADFTITSSAGNAGDVLLNQEESSNLNVAREQDLHGTSGNDDNHHDLDRVSRVVEGSDDAAIKLPNSTAHAPNLEAADVSSSRAPFSLDEVAESSNPHVLSAPQRRRSSMASDSSGLSSLNDSDLQTGVP